MESGQTMTIGRRIASARERAGLSQHALGVKVGCTGQAVLAWEKDRTSPRASDLAAIAAATGVRSSWLLEGTGRMRVSARVAAR